MERGRTERRIGRKDGTGRGAGERGELGGGGQGSRLSTEREEERRRSFSFFLPFPPPPPPPIPLLQCLPCLRLSPLCSFPVYACNAGLALTRHCRTYKMVLSLVLIQCPPDFPSIHTTINEKVVYINIVLYLKYR